jgi:hypothetical protein
LTAGDAEREGVGFAEDGGGKWGGGGDGKGSHEQRAAGQTKSQERVDLKACASNYV